MGYLNKFVATMLPNNQPVQVGDIGEAPTEFAPNLTADARL
jgi:hypothetical protein